MVTGQQLTYFQEEVKSQKDWFTSFFHEGRRDIVLSLIDYTIQPIREEKRSQKIIKRNINQLFESRLMRIRNKSSKISINNASHLLMPKMKHIGPRAPVKSIISEVMGK